MAHLISFDWWFYGGILVMALAVILFVASVAVFLIQRKSINKKLDEEYGQPQKYNRKGERG